ncbi:MAG: hypothetical protein QW774_03510 [Candidatus Micrarchaeaceae archaeon]
MKSYCIICGKEKQGIPIEEDFVIESIRWFKRNVTKNEQHNRLVVCRECYPKYAKQRKSFESRRTLYIALGIAFIILSVLISPRATTIAIAVAVAVFLYLLSFLSYMPKLDIESVKASAKERAHESSRASKT